MKFSSKQIVWAREMVAKIAAEGTWEIPANGCIYQFFRGLKEIHLVEGDPTKDDWHELNIQLFAGIGWTVLDRREENKGKTFKIKVDQFYGQGKTI